MTKHPVRTTIIATVVLLLFFTAQGAAVVMGNLEGLKAIAVQAPIIWGCALAAILFYLIKYRNLKGLGFNRPESGSAKMFLYYIPLIVVALSAFAGGLMLNQKELFIPNLIFTLGIGFAEEVYFRGIICNAWKEKEKTAIIVSAVLFGLCHILNVMGGAEITATLLQIVFAFVYGIIMAYVILRTKSIWPCILLHAFHDFCGFISNEGDGKLTIIVGAFQFVVLLAYCIYIARTDNKKGSAE